MEQRDGIFSVAWAPPHNEQNVFNMAYKRGISGMHLMLRFASGWINRGAQSLMGEGLRTLQEPKYQGHMLHFRVSEPNRSL